MADADERTLDRREFLERSGKVAVAAAVASQPAWLAACGSSHHHAATASHVGLPHGRCPHTGVGGFVLGRGFGFTSRTMAMLCDTLVTTDIITASGDMLTCDAHQNSDLYWACRGGSGGSFGINTSYTLQTHPLPDKVSVYKLDWHWSDAPAMLKALQAMTLTAPDELGCRIGLGATGLHEKKFEANT